MEDEHQKELEEIREAITTIKDAQVQQAKSVKVINKEMGETRDQVQELRLALVQSSAKLKEEVMAELKREMEISRQDRACLHQELGVIKERLKTTGNGRQWFEKTLIFLLGAALTIIGFLIKLL